MALGGVHYYHLVFLPFVFSFSISKTDGDRLDDKDMEDEPWWKSMSTFTRYSARSVYTLPNTPKLKARSPIATGKSQISSSRQSQTSVHRPSYVSIVRPHDVYYNALVKIRKHAL